MRTDHNFVDTQQDDYDSLTAKGRTAYDLARWDDGASHEEAFRIAFVAHGVKR